LKKISFKKKENYDNKDLLVYPEDIYKIKIDNIKKFQDIIKNKTLNDLQNLQDSPIDLSLVKNEKDYSKIAFYNHNLIKNSTKNTSENKKKISNNNANYNFFEISHKNPIFIEKEKNSLLNDINKKENFRFLNKLSKDKNYFNWLKFRQNVNDNKIDAIDNSKNTSIGNTNFQSDKLTNYSKNHLNYLKKLNMSFILNSPLLRIKDKPAIENKIKNYIEKNKNIINKLNKNLTILDKKILGINNINSVVEKNQNITLKSDTQNEKNTANYLIQTVNSNIGSNIKDIATKYIKDNINKNLDLKSKI
jgi:hypothetical protein